MTGQEKGDLLIQVTVWAAWVKKSEVRDQQFVGSDLTFSNPVKTDGPVETVQLRT